MPDSVVEVVQTGRRVESFEALVPVLADAIEAVEDEQVPALAARLVDLAKRIGGTDPEVLVWLRDGLASAVDRLKLLQGETDSKGRPLGTALAPTVRQLVETIEVLDSVHAPSEVSRVDEIRAARARRAAARGAGSEAV